VTVTEKSQFEFSDDVTAALAALDGVRDGRGWVNVVPVVDEDVPDLKVNVLGLWVNQGAPVATFVTEAPRQGVAQPSSLGILHSRGRLSRDQLTLLLGSTHFVVRQNHSQRGLLLQVVPDVASATVLDVMCRATEELCVFPVTGRWRLDLYLR